MRIVAKGLTYTYSAKSPFASRALNGVDLTVEEGEFFGIIGHTGSGKSTFVQHLNALIRLTDGSLKVGEYDLADKKCNFVELRSKVGMVFQYPEYQLFAETVEKDVAFGLKNFRKEMKQEERDAAVKEAIETVGLDYARVKDKSPFELSGGQQRRAAIAGVIVTKPEILILDEPAAGLDPLGKKELMELLHSIHGGVVQNDRDRIARYGRDRGKLYAGSRFFGRESRDGRSARTAVPPYGRAAFSGARRAGNGEMRSPSEGERNRVGNRFYLRRLCA